MQIEFTQTERVSYALNLPRLTEDMRFELEDAIANAGSLEEIAVAVDGLNIGASDFKFEPLHPPEKEFADVIISAA